MAQFAHVRTSLAKSNADEVQLAADPEDIQPVPDVPEEIQLQRNDEPHSFTATAKARPAGFPNSVLDVLDGKKV